MKWLQLVSFHGLFSLVDSILNPLIIFLLWHVKKAQLVLEIKEKLGRLDAVDFLVVELILEFVLELVLVFLDLVKESSLVLWYGSVMPGEETLSVRKGRLQVAV